MPPKKATQVKQTMETEKVSTTPVAAAAPETKKVKAPRKKVVKEEEEVKEEVKEVEAEVEEDTKLRVPPTKESVIESFDTLISFIDTEIDRLRESQNKAKGVKLLRTINKRVKTLRNQSVRVMKQKQRTNRKNNNNSGFLKPVRISDEMATFAGWTKGEQRSRVDVTKLLCQYIKEHSLQDEVDKRKIIPDKKLSKLLSFDSSKEKEPLTYYRLQSCIKNHFIKDAPATA